MKNLKNIKWAMIVAVSEKGFNCKYQSALKKAGFGQIGNTDVFANWFNADNIDSVKRVEKSINTFKAKVDSYKKVSAILAFTITDKQFGFIGTNKIQMKANVKTKIGEIPVSYEQMYGKGAIKIRGSQA